MGSTPLPRTPWRAWTLLVPLAGPPLVLLAVRRWDPGGDRGLANVLGAGIGLLLVLGWLAAFAGRSGHSRRVRLGVPLGVLVLVAVAGVLVRVDGVRGDMVPVLRWRLATGPATSAVGEAPADPGHATGGVLLEVVAGRDWPGFLGEGRDGRVAGTRLATDWDEHPPRELWRAPIGPGWSGFAIAGGWAVTIEQGADGELVTLRSARAGQVIWTRPGGARFTHGLGGDGPRATPAIAEGRVVVLGARGWLACLDGRDGAVLWEHDLLARFGITPEAEAEQLQYGRSSSPLVSDGRVVVPVGGPAVGLVAFDLATGAVLWEGPARAASYSSPVRGTLVGIDQVVVVNEASVSGHAFVDGRLLWEHPWPGRSSGDANASQPLLLHDRGGDGVLVSKGYGAGALRLDLSPGGQGLVAAERWHVARVLRTKFTSAVQRDGYLFGLDDGILTCVALADGKRIWKEGRFGHGQVLLADDVLVVAAEDGRILLVAPTPQDEGRVLASFQALEGKCWSVPAIADGVLLWRNDVECGAWELPRP
jgi:outer membrane protein assembly factor BamB